MKYALVIGNESYNDPKLAQLKTPAADSRALAKVLDDEKIGGFEEVISLINQTETEIRRAISSFLNKRKPDDLVLVYFSGHGVLDSSGRLFLASKDTQTSILRATAIPSTFITDEMDNCRSKRQILILDCCNSGAFARGTKAGEQKVVTEATFEGNGYGRVVLTASDSTQYALEGDQIIYQTDLSLFTHFLLEGLKSGDADSNSDGYISLDEWYEYTYSQVLSSTPAQVPHKWAYHQQGDLLIAKNPQYEVIKRKAAEKTAREEAERMAVERAIREKAEHEVAEKMARERLEREVAEKLAREKAQQRATQRAELISLFSRVIPSIKIVIAVGIIFGVFWVGSWAIPKLFASTPTAEANAPLMQQAGPSTLPAAPTIETTSSPTLSLTPTLSIANTPAIVDEQSFNIEHLETITVENLPKLTQLAIFVYDGNFLALSPSGKTMITDGGLIYNLETKQVICDISESLNQQKGDSFALTDDYAIVYIYRNDDQIKAWDLQHCTDKEISIPGIVHVSDIAISPNNIDILFTAGNLDNRHVLVNWNLESDEQKNKMTLGSSMIDMKIALDGVTFAASTGGGFAHIYTLSDFSVESKFAASTLWANIISYRPDKDILITSDEYPTTNTNIRVWRISDGKIIYRIPDVTKISDGMLGLSSDGKMYVVSKEKTLSVWGIDTDTILSNFELDKLVFGSVFSDNQKILLVLLDGNRMAVYGINPD